MQIELKLGKMSGKEIAKWFNVSYDYYSHHRKEKLNQIKNYCSFIEYRGGIEITEVYIPIYIKNLQDDDTIYLKEVMSKENHLTSLAGILRKLQRDNPEVQMTKYRITEAGKRAFGLTAEEDSVGTYGTRKYVWAVKVDDYNNYRFRTPEEDEIYYNIIKDYADTKEGIEFLEQSALLRRAFKIGEISAEEYLRKSNKDDDFFSAVINRFKEKTGYILTHATEHEVLESQKERVQELISK